MACMQFNSGTDLGAGYGGMVCGFHTRPADQEQFCACTAAV